MGHPLENLLENVELKVGSLRGRDLLPTETVLMRNHTQLAACLPTDGVFIVDGRDLRDSAIRFGGILGTSGNLGRLYHTNRGRLYFQPMTIPSVVDRRFEGRTTDIFSLNVSSQPFPLNCGDVLTFRREESGIYVQIQGVYRFDEQGAVELSQW